MEPLDGPALDAQIQAVWDEARRRGAIVRASIYKTTVEEVLLRLARVRVVRPADGGGWIVPDVQRLYEFAELLEPRRAAAAMSEPPAGAREEG